MKCCEEIKLSIVKIRIFNIHKDNWSLGFQFFLEIINIHFNVVLTFEIEPKQGNVESVNKLKRIIYFLRDISSKGSQKN